MYIVFCVFLHRWCIQRMLCFFNLIYIEDYSVSLYVEIKNFSFFLSKFSLCLGFFIFEILLLLTMKRCGLQWALIFIIKHSILTKCQAQLRVLGIIKTALIWRLTRYFMNRLMLLIPTSQMRKLRYGRILYLAHKAVNVSLVPEWIEAMPYTGRKIKSMPSWDFHSKGKWNLENY